MPKLFVVDDRASLYSIDTVTLAATYIGSTSELMTDIAFAPNGKLYGISFSDLYEINQVTGASTKIGSLGIGTANALGIDAAGKAYLATNGNAYLYSVNLSTGLATPIGQNSQKQSSAGDISFHGGEAYLATGNKTVAKLDLSTGAILSEKKINLDNLYGLAELNGITYGVAGKTLYAIDVETGAFQALKPLSVGGFGNFNGAATDDFGQTSFSQTAAIAFSTILRADAASKPNADYIANLLSQVGNGTLTQFAAIQQVVQKADASTTVATLSYQFFTGLIPTQGGYDYLVSANGGNPNNLASTYYQSFSMENRYINFSVNLGKVGEGKEKFQLEYGALSLFDATRKAYATIFGATPTDTKVHALLDPTFQLNGVTMSRADYFAAYGGDGPNGVGTKAAMVGWLLGEAVKADVGMFALASNAFLTDLADGAQFNVDLIGVYGDTSYNLT